MKLDKIFGPFLENHNNFRKSVTQKNTMNFESIKDVFLAIKFFPCVKRRNKTFLSHDWLVYKFHPKVVLNTGWGLLKVFKTRLSKTLGCPHRHQKSKWSLKKLFVKTKTLLSETNPSQPPKAVNNNINRIECAIKLKGSTELTADRKNNHNL